MQFFSDRFILGVCRLGVVGLAPKAPGTWASLLAVVLAPMFFLPLSLPLRCLVLFAIFVLGSRAATRAEQILGQKDPGEVVVDELLGMWCSLLIFPEPTLAMLVAAFLFFRLFDIVKPWPVRASEDWLPGGWGVMLDDLLAGVLACACLWILTFLHLL